MRKEDTSAQGKIVTEILQHLHACINSVKVFYGRVGELEQLKDYITGVSNKPFVLYGAGGSGINNHRAVRYSLQKSKQTAD